MNCKHKNKTRMYVRKSTTWSSRDIWECDDCGAILGIAQIKLKSVNVEPTLREKTHEAFYKGGEQR